MPHPAPRRPHALLLVALAPLHAAVAAPATPPAPPPPAPAAEAQALAIAERNADSEQWYIVHMAGAPAGTMRSFESRRDGRITTGSEMTLKVRRGEIDLQFSVAYDFTETEDGTPLQMSSLTAMGPGGGQRSTYVFEADAVILTTGEGDNARTERLPLPEGPWLAPAAAERYVRERMRANPDSITVRTIDPTAGLRVISATRSKFEEVDLDLPAGPARATRCVTRVDAMPGVDSIEYLDEQGEMLRTDTALGPFKISLLRTTKALAQGSADAPAAELPEVMTATFIRPSQPIAAPRRAARAVYTLSLNDNAAMPDLPTTGRQTVERLNEQTLRVTVDLGAPSEPGAAAPTTTAPSVYITADDPLVQALAGAAAATAPAQDAASRAESLRRAAHAHVNTKALSVAFATAAEVARSKEGDCSEHAVLLAAMLRAQGIPSRVVSGLVYADQFAGQSDIFGYHMWAQALLPDADGTQRWTDLDATFPPALAFDATHISLGVSDLAGGTPTAALLEIAPLMGRLRITVEHIE